MLHTKIEKGPQNEDLFFINEERIAHHNPLFISNGKNQSSTT